MKLPYSKALGGLICCCAITVQSLAWQQGKVEEPRRVYVEPFTTKAGSEKLRDDVIAELRKVRSISLVACRNLRRGVHSSHADLLFPNGAGADRQHLRAGSAEDVRKILWTVSDRGVEREAIGDSSGDRSGKANLLHAASGNEEFYLLCTFGGNGNPQGCPFHRAGGSVGHS